MTEPHFQSFESFVRNWNAFFGWCCSRSRHWRKYYIHDFLLFTVIILMRSFLSIQKLVGRILWLAEIVLHTCIFEYHWLIRNSNQDSRKVIILIIIFNICPRLADVFNYILLKMPNFLLDSCHHVIMCAWDLDFWSKLERIFETFQIR